VIYVERAKNAGGAHRIDGTKKNSLAPLSWHAALTILLFGQPVSSNVCVW
jgi:hypothetical protein